MRVFRHFSPVPDEARGAVVAIGNFDGIHRGHQAVIGKAGRLARELGVPHAVLTFEPHPRSYFKPDTPPFRLTPFRIKARLIEALGVDSLFVLRFDRALASLSAEDFVMDILVKGLGVRHVVVGDNFHFGHKRGGDPALLERLGRSNGFGVTCMERVAGAGEEPYSSTYVRDYLTAGNPTRAALLLGRYWEIEGRVQHGDKRGRDLGFPTANVPLGNILLPAFGVYAVRAGIDRGADTVWHGGAANIGIRPMFESKRPLLEVHIFDFAREIYGRHMRVALVDYLRPELAFDGLEALKVQMAEDCRRARISLAYEDWEAGWPASPFMAPTLGPDGWS
ncbi:MAG: bifunctional riboflavin kinase/FAD synthetase [Kiloniellales bacterium]